ncbi:hypothetical protein [Paenarthrobacter nitroguajacolicus]|uniref:hypothetical protein n=1 Tax=Paenarthrobacter nitroguajacolicus TaxID=211146 RepID=UPI0040544573
MSAVVVTQVQGEVLPERALETPASNPGPSMRTSLLDEVWTASARVEGLQWEMDEASDCMASAMRNAAAAGAGLPDLAIASGLSFAEIERLLEVRPLA